MADENTQTAPVAGAEESNATQENKGFTYYFSDPDSANAEMHHVVITLPYELPELPWRWHTEKPDDSLKDPVWDLKTNGWVENSKDGQAQILAEAQAKIAELNKSKEQLDQTLKSVQENQSNGTAQTLTLTKAIKALSEGQANQNKLLSSMQNLMLQLASGKATAPAVPTQPTTDDKTTDNTNGGNN